MPGEDKADDESALFREAMRGVNRSGRNYQQKRAEPAHRKPEPPAVPSRRKKHLESPVGPVAVNHTGQTQNVLFVRSGVQNRVVRRLKRGELLPGSDRHELDLHGARSWQVADLLDDFISESVEHGQSCVLVIHGKGFRSESRQGVVKPLTVAWLQNAPDVLAFSSALPRDGGTGAVYVLLKRRRSE